MHDHRRSGQGHRALRGARRVRLRFLVGAVACSAASSATSILATFKNIGKRFTFGGEPPKDQRVYYFNTKELIGNKYGTPSPVPFRVVDQRAGIDIDIAIRCFGEYSYRICDPILFYTNVCGNVTDGYHPRPARQPAQNRAADRPAARLCARSPSMGIRYSSLPGHTMEMADALNDVLSSKWRNLRGLEIVSFGVSSVKASEEDEKMLKEMQRNAAFMDPTRAAAHLVGAQASAMQTAANNQNAGPAMAFMGMNMAGQAGGVNAQNLYQMGAQQAAQQPAPAAAAPAAPAGAWTCPQCGKTATGKFCPECGAKKPEADGWTCPTCGKLNKGKFCAECGTKKPAGTPKYKCDKCGWEPEDPTHPPKFCPECGDPFNDGDIIV